MLKSKVTKFIIGAIGIVAVLAVASICVTSIFKKADVEEFDYTKLAGAEDTVSTSLTQIDYIIQETKDSSYKVLILTDSSSAVDETSFFKDGTFRNWVINENRTIAEEMAEGKVDVEVKTASSFKGLTRDKVSEAISGYDLIYLHSTFDGSAFTGTNSISEDLYECLQNYISSNKPMILSYYQIQNTQKDTVDITDTTSTGYDSEAFKLTTKTFKNSWKRTNTTNITDWSIDTLPGAKANAADPDQVQDVIKNYISSYRSTYSRYYIGPYAPSGYASWDEFWKRMNPAGDPTLQILFIYGGDTTDGVTYTSLEAQKADIEAVAQWMVSDTGKPIVFNAADASNIPSSYKVNAVRADQLIVNSVDGTPTENALYVNGVKQYDYIFIAPDNYRPSDIANPTDFNTANDNAVIKALQTLSTDTSSNTYIMFGTLKGKTVTNSTTTQVSEEHTTFTSNVDTSTNYGKLVDLSVTTTSYAKKSNVLPVGKTYLKDINSFPSDNQKKIASIVSLLNKSTFKTHSGNGGGGNSGSISTEAYRVLELEPCYPIDLDVAYSSTVSSSNSYYASAMGRKGNYYTVPGNVVDGVTEDEVSGTTEYYQWDLTPAKVSYALNIPVEQIEVVHMSTAEFISSKANVTDAYDLIYIGGNRSAMKPLAWYNRIDNQSVTASNQPASSYAMYSHTGEILNIVSQKTGPNGDKMVASSLDYYFTTLNGNDITLDRLNALKDYVDSGMPLVIGSELWDRYDVAKRMSNPYENRYLDPDSNLYAFLTYVESKARTNVICGWENKVSRATAATVWKAGVSDATKNDYLKDYYVSVKEADLAAGQTVYQTHKVENSDGVYGSAAEVTVYNDTLSNDLYSLVMLGNLQIRPKMTVETNAVSYDSADPSTKIRKPENAAGDVTGGVTLYWNVTLNNYAKDHKYTAYLLEDLNDNAEFDISTEAVDFASFTLQDTTAVWDSSKNPYTAKLTYSVDKEFWGAISWKVVVQDTTVSSSTAMANGTASISVIARGTNEAKKEATILEIMPMSLAKNGHYYSEHHDYAAQDGHSLYLDATVQQGTGQDYLYSSLDDTNYYSSNKSIATALDTTNGNAAYKYYEYSGKIAEGGYAFTSNGGDGGYWKSTNVYSSQYAYGSNNSIYLGKYQTKLSIDRFDKDMDNEDWTYNYIDEISDDYDLTLDIMYLDDIEYYAYQANKLTDAQRESYAKLAEKSYEAYMEYMVENYTEKYPTSTDGSGNKVVNPADPYTKLDTCRQNLNAEIAKIQTDYNITLNANDQKALKSIVENEDYFKIFYINPIKTKLVYNRNQVQALYDAYVAYVKENDKKIDAYRAWRHYNLLSYDKNQYLRQNYDVIVVGFFDDLKYGYDFSEQACNSLLAFLEDQKIKDAEGNETELQAGSILMTHDNMKKFETSINSWDYQKNYYSDNFTSVMRGIIGQDRFHFEKDSSTDGAFVMRYKSVLDGEELSSANYFVSSVSTKYNFSKSSTYSAAQWKTNSNAFVNSMDGNSFIAKTVGTANAGTGRYIVGYPGLTNTHSIIRTNSSPSFPNTYEEYEVTEQMSWNMDQNSALKLTGTTKVSQVNRGVVTTYPFYIPSDIKVSPTHSQTFALDLEDDTVTAWYTLAADNLTSSNGKTVAATSFSQTVKNNSSSYAASPKDAMNNYYIYSKGNITYCGAGHCAVTGASRDNNDERRLFINVLVNLANKANKVKKKDPIVLTLYDPETKKPATDSSTRLKKLSDDLYSTDISATYPSPEFGLQLKLNEGQKATSIMFFYDLDYTSSQKKEDADRYVDNDKHKLIALTDDQKTKILQALNKGDTIYILSSEYKDLFKPDASYFDDEGYAYLVVQVNVADQVITKRIRLRRVKDLLDLT